MNMSAIMNSIGQTFDKLDNLNAYIDDEISDFKIEN